MGTGMYLVLCGLAQRGREGRAAAGVYQAPEARQCCMWGKHKGTGERERGGRRTRVSTAKRASTLSLSPPAPCLHTIVCAAKALPPLQCPWWRSPRSQNRTRASPAEGLPPPPSGTRPAANSPHPKPRRVSQCQGCAQWHRWRCWVAGWLQGAGIVLAARRWGVREIPLCVASWSR